MGNLSNGDMREICDTVRGTVMEQINQKVAQLYPQIVAQITQELEKKYSDRISQLETKIAKLECMGNRSEDVPCSGKTTSNTTKKIDVSRLLYSGFKFNGWIYYANEEMGDFLYKVRNDGTDNTQLTDYSVGFSSCWSVSNGYLNFVRSKPFQDEKMKLV